MKEGMVQCYVTIDEHGNIMETQQGKSIIPDGEVDFFFWVEDHIDPDAYQVVIKNMRAELVLRDENA